MFLLIAYHFTEGLSHFFISIHLMFLLIRVREIMDAEYKNFNTSHVSINLDGGLSASDVALNFNTSHVSINHKAGESIVLEQGTFQYISCFY